MYLFRLYVLVTGFIPYLLAYKPKVYYEAGARRDNRIKGGALIVSNHFLFMDYPMTMFHWFGRQTHCVMLEFVFKKSPFLRFFTRIIGGISAERDAKRMDFMDESVRELRKGHLVQIYPEAHNTPDGEIHDFKPSYLLIALRAGTPIVPFILDGNYGIFKRAHAIVGKPIDLREYCDSEDPTREEIESLNRLVRGRALELKKELERRRSLGSKHGKRSEEN